MKKICPNCGAETEGNFCPDCGANLTVLPSQEEIKNDSMSDKEISFANARKVCPNCGAETEGEFCPDCGTSLTAPVNQGNLKNHSANDEENPQINMKKVCPNCGAETEENFCPDCGTYLTTPVNQEEMREDLSQAKQTRAEDILSHANNTENNSGTINRIPKVHKENALVEKIKKLGLKKLIAVVIGVCVLIGVGYYISLPPTINDETNCNDYQLHNMEYSIPVNWDIDEKHSGEVAAVYNKTKDGKTIAILEVEYKGEEDLTSGDAAYDAENAEHPYADYVSDTFSNPKGTYSEISADNAVFCVSVNFEEGSVRGESELLNLVKNSFNTDEYKNPRKSMGYDIKYSGDTKAGTEINSESNITVTENFDTGVNTGSKNATWEIKNPVTLKAGATSTIKINVDGKETTFKVECSTLSKAQYKAKCKTIGYKSQLRKESIGKYIKIYGKVVQDCGEDDSGNKYFRISSGGSSYDDVYMVCVPSDCDIVEDDWVTAYGVTSGIYEYTTVMGASQKVPSMVAKYVDR